MVITKTRGV